MLEVEVNKIYFVESTHFQLYVYAFVPIFIRHMIQSYLNVFAPFLLKGWIGLMLSGNPP